jgi:hypothetical protein
LRAVLATSPSSPVRDALQCVLDTLAEHLRAPSVASSAAVCAAVLAASPHRAGRPALYLHIFARPRGNQPCHVNCPYSAF